jgi:hypothetical protein
MSWNIKILYSQSVEDVVGSSASSGAVILDRGLFETLSGLLSRNIDPAFPRSSRVLHVQIDESAPELQQALDLLSGAGLKPVFQAMVSPEQRGKFFPVRRERADFELDSSNWLQLIDAGSDGGMISSLRDGQLVVKADGGKLRKAGHCLNLLWCEFAVSEDFKKAFEDAGLVGAVFRPLAYDPPAPKCKRQYWMDSEMTAPWSIDRRRIIWTRSKDMEGVEIGETNEPFEALDDGDVLTDAEGYLGRGATYRRKDMVPYEGVDYMRAAEWHRVRNGVWRSYHLVSQRFRSWARKFGCRFVMNGVKLID